MESKKKESLISLKKKTVSDIFNYISDYNVEPIDVKTLTESVANIYNVGDAVKILTEISDFISIETKRPSPSCDVLEFLKMTQKNVLETLSCVDFEVYDEI